MKNQGTMLLVLSLLLGISGGSSVQAAPEKATKYGAKSATQMADIPLFAEEAATNECIVPQLTILGDQKDYYFTGEHVRLRATHSKGARIEYKFEHKELQYDLFGPEKPSKADSATKVTELAVQNPGKKTTDGDLTENISGYWKVYARAKCMLGEPDKMKPQPTAVTDWSAPVEFVFLHAGSSGVWASVKTEPASYSGPCPKTVLAYARILCFRKNYTVNYSWKLSDGQTAPGGKLIFNTPGSIQETNLLGFLVGASDGDGYKDPPHHGAIRLIHTNQQGTSTAAAYEVNCPDEKTKMHVPDEELLHSKFPSGIFDLSLEGFEIEELASGKPALDGTTAGRSRYYPSWTVRNKGQAESAPTMLSVACLGEGGGSQQCPAGLQGSWPVPALAAGGSFTVRGDKAVMMPPEGVRLKLTATLAAGGAADNVEPRRLVSFFPEAPLAGGQGVKEPDGSLEIASRHGLDRERGSALKRTIKGAEGGEATAAGEEEADTKGPGALAPLSLAKRSAGGAAARGLQPMDGKLNLVRAPKVKVQRLWAVPASPKADQPFALHMMLLNQGSEASEPGQRYQLSCGGQRGGPCPIALEPLTAARPIAPNGTMELKLEQLKAPAGSYRVTAAPASGEAGLGATLNLMVAAPALSVPQNLPLRSSATGAAGATSAPADRSPGTARTSRP